MLDRGVNAMKAALYVLFLLWVTTKAVHYIQAMF
jgi:hypothetical protein